MKKILIIAFLVLVITGTVFTFWLSSRYTVPILVYHSIGYQKGSFFVSPQSFFKQMEYLQKNGYQVISLDELSGNIRKQLAPKRKQVVITFDDGYQSNFQYAYPILKKFGFPATIFVITDLVGTGGSGKGMEFANWDQIVQMSRDGIAIGSHSKTHYNFDGQMDEKKALAELQDSKKIIEGKIDRPVEYFCYPSGAFNDQAKSLVAQAGYKGACTTNRGFVKLNRDLYELKRIKITNADALRPFSFWAKLSGYYTIFKKERNPY